MAETHDSIFTLRSLVSGFDQLQEQGVLTPEQFLDAWRRDRALQNYPQQNVRNNAPYVLLNELAHHTSGGLVAKLLRTWKPCHGIRLPLVIDWLGYNDERWTLFETFDMDRASLVRELLDDPFFGPRMRFEVAQWPRLLTCLPEEERWERLEACVREFASAIAWQWPQYTAEHWSKNRAIALVRRLIVSDAECAGGFLVGEEAHVGWSIFWEISEFLKILEEAGARAPYEACLNRQWIATSIGDRIANNQSFMNLSNANTDQWYGWWMDPDTVHREFGPKGEEAMKHLIDRILHTIDFGRDVDSSLSGCSRFFASMFKEALTKFDKPENAREIAELLIDLPDCSVARELVNKLLNGCQKQELGMAYRWLRSIRWRFDRTRYYVLVHSKEWRGGAAYNKYDKYRSDGEREVKNEWFDNVMRAGMEERGWQFRHIEYRRNDKWREDSDRAYDLQIVTESGGYRNVYSLWRGMVHHYGDHFPSKPPRQGKTLEVMIPPNFDPGEVKYSSGSLRIFHVGTKLMPATRWELEYLSKFPH